MWPSRADGVNDSVRTILFVIEQSRQPDRTYDEVAGLIEGIGRGELRAVIDRTLPFADAADATAS